MDISNILNRIVKIEHGFNHIIDGCDEILSTYSNEQCLKLAIELFRNEAYQVRMLATMIFGRLGAENNDENWRVQEMLAKAFDEVCKCRGYKASLPLVEEWMNNNNPNIIRAVTEGLRIWTSRPFFKENPSVAINLISKHKANESEYLRKSVGNALKDISKKHAELIRIETQQWNLSDARVLFTYKLATKLLK